jgi:hypothetical protein
MKSWRELRAGFRLPSWIVPVLAAAGVALFLLPLVSPVIDYPKWDEYIVVYDAQRVLGGSVPYRDFFNFIPPGTFYLLAALFAPFGKATLTVARYAALAVALANWLVLWLVLERAGWTRRTALFLSLLYPICLYPFWPVISHHWLVHLPCFGFLLVAAKATEGLSAKRAAAMGLLAGLAGAFLQTEGLYLALLGGTLVLLAERGGEAFRKLGAFAGGMAVPLGAVFLPLVLSGAGGAMVRDLLLWPSRNYSREGNDNARFLLDDVPIRLEALWSGVHPPEMALRALLAVAGTALYVLLLMGAVGVVTAACGVLIRTLRSRRSPAPLALAACLLTFLSLGLFLRGRPDWLRLVYFSGFIGAVWLVAAAQSPPRGKGMRRLVLSWAMLALLAGGLYQSRWAWAHWPQAWELFDVDRPVRESPVNQWLRSPGVLKPGDTIAAFPEGGEAYLYGAPAAVGYTFFMPLSDGYNSERDHEIAAEEMRKNGARWVLLTPDLEKAYLDPASAVGRLLTENYERRGRVGGAVVYGRRPVSKLPTP